MPAIYRIITALLLCIVPVVAPAQVATKPYAEAETNTYFSSGQMLPFWMMSKQWGKYSPEASGNVSSVGLFSRGQKAKEDPTDFNIGYGLEISSRYTGSNNNVWLHQGYVHLTYKNLFKLSGGLWEETMGNQYEPLSSGGIIWSGNARPLPRIEAGTDEYIKVPFSKGKLEAKATLTHGWFEQDRYVNNVLLHHKFFGLRTSWDFPLSVNFGFHHFAQWGGQNERYGQLPNDLEAFKNIFFVKEGGEDARQSDQKNKSGNHIGSQYLGLDWKKRSATIGIYYQDLFEDGSGQRKKNFPDGLWGIYFENDKKSPLIKGVVYEWLYTNNQSGPIHDNEGGLGGNDNYFNHGGYRFGWTAWNMTIGTPFITSPAMNVPVFQLMEPTKYDNRFSNNRVNVHHVGIMGSLTPQTEYRFMGSFSNNKGLYEYDDDNWRPEVYRIHPHRDQWSFRADLKHFWNHWNLETTLTVAADIGDMYGDNFGMMLGVRVPFYEWSGEGK